MTKGRGFFGSKTAQTADGNRPPGAGEAKAVNRTKGTEIALRLEVADSPSKRSKGLLGRNELPYGSGIWIVPCESVHTFWMRFSIDLIYIDRGLRVKKVSHCVKPWRISACLSASSVIELPCGAIAQSKTEVGDELEIVTCR